MLTEHRQQLLRQREDIEITLAEIAQHEARCRTLLAAAAALPPRARRDRAREGTVAAARRQGRSL